MHTFAEILDETVSLTTDETYIRHATRCSGYCRRLLASDGRLLLDLLQNLHQPFSEQQMRDFLQELTIPDEAALKHVLRKLRQRVMLRVIARDLNGLADLQEVMQSMSTLAEVAVQFALQYLTPWQEASHGAPMGENGSRQQLLVVGMGKLGGGELNVSSDIDLIFAYEEDGETDGKKPLSNHDFFIRLAKKLIAAIDEVTADGFVFRVDMRLRPYGSEGPLACSFAMLEDYYQTQGREWERYAWIKGRVIAGQGEKLAQLLRPFVFRKYLDYGAFESMRDLKIKIHQDVNRKGMQDNIKLGRGGIREIEFIAQVFQLIRGGQDIRLQIRPTLSVLPLLQARQLLPNTTVDELNAAYIFLRNLEHRLQYVEDAQTQELPTTEEAKARIALSMNFSDWAALRAELDQHRARVERHFSEVFSETGKSENIVDPQDDSSKKIWQGTLAEAEAHQHLLALGYHQAEETLRRLQSQRNSARYRQLPELSRQRFDALMPLVIELAAQEAQPETTLMRVADLLDSICRRASYLALLAEYPAALHLVIKLASASPWLMQYLTQHPILLDELLDTRNLYAEPDFAAMREELNRRLQEVAGDTERLMDVMRHFKHAAVFRFAAQEIAGDLPLVKLSDYLSALADLILQATIDTLWQSLRGKHRDTPKFAVIGYGKLGGKELGYASDLDIIFLYDDEVAEAGEVYARLGQRINTWLSSLTGAGYLYETDMRLRPDGASGLLVSSVAAFRDYQQNKAWIWEHQALTRARYCAGDASIGTAFEQIRIEILRKPREAEKLRAEVIAMRQKMHGGHANTSELFDLKHDTGGIVDVEFIVQYLVLRHAVNHIELTQNLGNIGLLKILGDLGLIDAKLAEVVALAYRDFRHLQHAIRLQGEGKARVAFAEVQAQINAVRSLWSSVLDEY